MGKLTGKEGFDPFSTAVAEAKMDEYTKLAKTCSQNTKLALEESGAQFLFNPDDDLAVIKAQGKIVSCLVREHEVITKIVEIGKELGDETVTKRLGQTKTKLEEFFEQVDNVWKPNRFKHRLDKSK